jgi:hypothetical protein
MKRALREVDPLGRDSRPSKPQLAVRSIAAESDEVLRTWLSEVSGTLHARKEAVPRYRRST